jgi:hypothetical protein
MPAPSTHLHYVVYYHYDLDGMLLPKLWWLMNQFIVNMVETGRTISENLIFSRHTMHKFGLTQSKFLPSCRNCNMEALGDKGRSDA